MKFEFIDIKRSMQRPIRRNRRNITDVQFSYHSSNMGD